MADDDDADSAERMLSPARSSTPLNLPKKMILEILIRLPIKSCFRCKSVSKLWLSLISEPYFIRRFICHHQQSLRISSNIYKTYMNSITKVSKKRRKMEEKPFVPPEPIDLPFTVVSPAGDILLRNPVFQSSDFSFTYLPQLSHVNGRYVVSEYIEVVGSSNDLLLCCPGGRFRKDYYICNPLTKQWVQLPEAPSAPQKVLTGLISEPFYTYNNEQGVVDLNFGYSYKVIRFIEEGGLQAIRRVEVFSSETGKWSASLLLEDLLVDRQGNFPQLQGIFSEQTAVIANGGLLYWWWSRRSFLIGCDPLNRFVNIIQKPGNMSTEGRMGHIGSCNGRIRISQLVFPVHDVEAEPSFSIWELDDSDSGNWQLLCVIYLKNLISKDLWLAKQFKSVKPKMPSIHIHPHDGDLVYLVYEWRIALVNIYTMAVSPISKKHRYDYGIAHDNNAFALQFQSWPSPLHRSQASWSRAKATVPLNS